jgi:DNA replication protein DnaC
MDEKSVRFIQNLDLRSGARVGPATPKDVPPESAEDGVVCPLCGGTGWKIASREADRRVARCDCFLSARADRLLKSSNIPTRYSDCEFRTYKTTSNPSFAAAKINIEAWVDHYPLDQTGLLIIGPSGLGKTHLAVAAMKGVARKGFHALFCDYRELLKQIQNSYNPSSQTTELGLLSPVFETEVLLLDDLGAVKPSEWVWDTVSFVLNTRYNSKRSTIITCNFLDGPSANAEGVSGPKKAAREETLGDRIGERMRSRLFEMCRLVSLDGKDFRQTFRSTNFR